MKIVLDNDSLVFVLHQFQIGGVESVFMNLINMLTDKKIYLVLAVNNIDEELIKRIDSKVEVISFGAKSSSLKKIISIVFELKKKYVFKNACVINFSDTLSTLLIQRFLGGKSRMSWVHCNPLALSNSRSYSIYKFLLSGNDKVVCLCESQKKILLDLIPKVDNKIEIIYNSVNINELTRLSEEKLDINYKYFVKISRFDNRTKDFYTVIDAYLGLSKNLRDEYKLVLLGDGPDRNNVENYIKEREGSEYVILPGRDVNPFRWIHHAEFLVHSSVSEGFCLVLLEAMLLGKTVVAADCNCGPSDILNQGESGFLFKIRDVKMLEEILHRLLSDPKLIRTYNEVSFERGLILQMKAINQVKELFGE